MTTYCLNELINWNTAGIKTNWITLDCQMPLPNAHCDTQLVKLVLMYCIVSKLEAQNFQATCRNSSWYQEIRIMLHYWKSFPVHDEDSFFDFSINLRSGESGKSHTDDLH